uniref:Uncharacterized protein n=1 Tax=Arundo donax TaxID=35708 RepID=A0A0A8ZEM6_ARUDO
MIPVLQSSGTNCKKGRSRISHSSVLDSSSLAWPL